MLQLLLIKILILYNVKSLRGLYFTMAGSYNLIEFIRYFEENCSFYYIYWIIAIIFYMDRLYINIYI